jgi:hypothetical protein
MVVRSVDHDPGWGLSHALIRGRTVETDPCLRLGNRDRDRDRDRDRVSDSDRASSCDRDRGRDSARGRDVRVSVR